MARLRFNAAGHEHATCEAFGREFPHGEWVDAEGMNPEHVATLASNPTFEHEPDEPEPEAPRPRRGAAQASEG